MLVPTKNILATLLIPYEHHVGNLFVLIIHLVMNASSFCVNAIVEVAPYSS